MPRDVAAYICPVLLSLAFCAALPKQRQPPLVTASLSLTELRPTVKRAIVAKPVVQGPSKVLVGSEVTVTCRVDVAMALQNLSDVRWDVGSLSSSAYEADRGRNESSYFLVLTIRVTKAEVLFNKTVFCIFQSPSGMQSASWNPEVTAPPMMPVITGPARPLQNTNITASCNAKGALGTKPEVHWLDIFNTNVTTHESSNQLVHVNTSKIPFWDVTAFLSLTLDNTLGNRSFKCLVAHPETNTLLTRRYTFTVVDDSKETSEAQPGRDDDAREFLVGFSWFLAGKKPKAGSSVDLWPQSASLRHQRDLKNHSAHAKETSSGLKEVLEATKELQVPGLQTDLLKEKFALQESSQSKVQYMPREMAFGTPDSYSKAKLVAIIIGAVLLAVLIVLGVVTHFRRNSAPCYCC